MGTVLICFDLIGIILTGIDLTVTVLIRITFIGADLMGIVLTGINLLSTVVMGINLT